MHTYVSELRITSQGEGVCSMAEHGREQITSPHHFSLHLSQKLVWPHQTPQSLQERLLHPYPHSHPPSLWLELAVVLWYLSGEEVHDVLLVGSSDVFMIQLRIGIQTLHQQDVGHFTMMTD